MPVEDASPPAFRVERLSLRGWRNLASLDLVPGPRFHVLHGDNGQGKSNLLEAIYYLGSLKSFRGARKEDLLGHGVDGAILAARFRDGDLTRVAKIALPASRARQVKLDGKRPRSTASWLTQIPMVLFHPGDLALASGSPEARRSFLDRILEQSDRGYSPALSAYTKALRSRNRLLKDPQADRRSVTAYDPLLAQHGAVVGQARARVVEALAGRCEAVFHEVAGRELPLTVAYRAKVEPTEEALRAALTRSLTKDRARGFTGVGPHGDDLALTVGEDGARGARHHASQGQHRMMVLAMKAAELELLARRVGRVPVLLLDDVSSELDEQKNARFFGLLDRLGGQVFLTTTRRDLIALDGPRVDSRVRAGRVETDER